MNHQTRPIQVWVDVDLGIANLVEYLNTVPGVRTLASCEGGKCYHPQVMITWSDGVFDRLQQEFDIEILGDHWGYIHPKEVV
jgi:hypothetical protein